MDIAALFQIALYQLLTARDAPLPVVLASVVVGLIVWWLTRWRSTSAIQNLKRALVRRDAELEKLRGYVSPAADLPDGPDERRVPSVDRRKALQPIVNAIDEAALALRTGDPRDVDRAMTSMALALQGVNRHFGLPVPAVGASAIETLATGKRYLEQVRPPLRAGQDDEAHGAAVAFLSR